LERDRSKLLSDMRNSLEDIRPLANGLAEYCSRAGIGDQRLSVAQQRAAAHFALDRVLDEIIL
jgi:hypothetical protein